MKYMLISNSPEIASAAASSGVNTIFLDLERMGKFERQGHRDTHISDHELSDIAQVRAAIPETELLVRINPLHDRSQYEIDSAIEQGADLIMLPMFHDADTVKTVGAMIRGRVNFMPLVETEGAMRCIEDVAKLPEVDEVYIGLNDLHLSLGLTFMFELLANGSVERMAGAIKVAGKPFGFGGIARIGEGALPAELILAEHVRLGSSRVILSRTFHRGAKTLEQLNAGIGLHEEIKKLTDKKDFFISQSKHKLDEHHTQLKAAVEHVKATL